jgi:hypothetical protein
LTTSILIVDDTPTNLQVLAGMLKEQGYKQKKFKVMGNVGVMGEYGGQTCLLTLEIAVHFKRSPVTIGEAMIKVEDFLRKDKSFEKVLKRFRQAKKGIAQR